MNEPPNTPEGAPQWRLVFFAVCIFAVLVFFVVSQAKPGLMHSGRSLKSWLWELEAASFDRDEQLLKCPEAVAAIQAIGASALPLLLDYLQATNGGVRDRLSFAVEELQLDRGPFDHSERRQQIAASGFVALGEAATPAIPELLRLLYQTKNGNYAHVCLGAVGTNALPSLIAALRNDSATVQTRAILALRRMGTNAAAATPLVLAIADRPDAKSRRHAITALGPMGLHSDLYLPVLGRALTSWNEEVQYSALNSLESRDLEVMKLMPQLTMAATNPASKIRNKATKFVNFLDPEQKLPPAP